ncbi:MAG: tetratricopeptide repeat protein, partial [Rhodothermales bacterium]|nr:tetratricopeptide repeat protein [Rhodothermales bacterium]
MNALSHPNPAPADESTASDVVARAPAPGTAIVTRNQLPRTRLGDAHGILTVEPRAEPDGSQRTIVTRRRAWLRRRRRKRILTAVALVLALFPPMWAVYLVAWLIWRSQPKQQSMRRVRQAVKALEKDQAGVAMKQLQEAHYLDPSNSDALYWLGLLLSQQNRQEEAEEALSLVAERVPGLPEVEAALVDAYVAMGEADGAIYHAQRLQDLAPYATETLLKLADAFEAAGQLDLAIRALEQAP